MHISTRKLNLFFDENLQNFAEIKNHNFLLAIRSIFVPIALFLVCDMYTVQAYTVSLASEQSKIRV